MLMGIMNTKQIYEFLKTSCCPVSQALIHYRPRGTRGLILRYTANRVLSNTGQQIIQKRDHFLKQLVPLSVGIFN